MFNHWTLLLIQHIVSYRIKCEEVQKKKMRKKSGLSLFLSRSSKRKKKFSNILKLKPHTPTRLNIPLSTKKRLITPSEKSVVANQEAISRRKKNKQTFTPSKKWIGTPNKIALSQ